MRAVGAPAGGAERRGAWIPWLFVGFFGLVLVANAIMIWLAVSTWTGLETEGAYQKGLAYNRSLEGARAQTALGWTAELEVREAEGGRTLVALDLSDRFGNSIRKAEVRARFVRPTHAGHDVDTELVHEPDGTWRSEVALPLAGQWDVEVGVVSPRGTYRLEERVFIRP